MPGKDIQIDTTGLRPGEKLYEELLLDASRISQSPHEKILVEGELSLPADFDQKVDKLLRSATQGQALEVRQGLQELVPGAKLLQASPA